MHLLSHVVYMAEDDRDLCSFSAKNVCWKDRHGNSNFTYVLQHGPVIGRFDGDSMAISSFSRVASLGADILGLIQVGFVIEIQAIELVSLGPGGFGRCRFSFALIFRDAIRFRL